MFLNIKIIEVQTHHFIKCADCDYLHVMFALEDGSYSFIDSDINIPTIPTCTRYDRCIDDVKKYLETVQPVGRLADAIQMLSRCTKANDTWQMQLCSEIDCKFQRPYVIFYYSKNMCNAPNYYQLFVYMYNSLPYALKNYLIMFDCWVAILTIPSHKICHELEICKE